MKKFVAIHGTTINMSTLDILFGINIYMADNNLEVEDYDYDLTCRASYIGHKIFQPLVDTWDKEYYEKAVNISHLYDETYKYNRIAYYPGMVVCHMSDDMYDGSKYIMGYPILATNDKNEAKYADSSKVEKLPNNYGSRVIVAKHF